MKKNKVLIILISLILVIVIVGILIIILQPEKSLSNFVSIKSIEENYNTNEVIVEFDENKIAKISLITEDKKVELKNKSLLKISEDLNGQKYQISILVEYKDGTEEVLNKEYEVYSECDKNVKLEETTSCKDNCENSSKDLIIKTIDENTGKICKYEQKTTNCDGNKCEDNSKNEQSTNQQNKTENEIKNDSIQIQQKQDCTLSIINGTKGENEWYISNVTIKLNTGNDAIKYGISTTNKVSYNNKKEITIKEETSQKTYYGYVKYKDGKETKCQLELKIDKTKPTIPSSQIRQNSSSGPIENNTKKYRNFRVWWGNFNSKDSTSQIASYEYSTKCSGKSNGVLKSNYLYPAPQEKIYDSYYCIRSIDNAGNKSDWSEPYYFYADLVKPTCTISENSNSLLKIKGIDNDSGINSYSINNGEYSTTTTTTTKPGTKTIVYVKDNAGNIGGCEYIDRIKTMIVIGDSRTYNIQSRLSGKNIIEPDVYEIESSKVYFVARAGGYYPWFKEGMTNGCTKGDICKTSAIKQVNQLLEKFNQEQVYRNVFILSNLGVNDLNKYDLSTAANNYTKTYDQLIETSWKSTKHLNITFGIISVNPIDETLIQCKTNNIRTNKKINDFNSIMKSKYKINYFDSNTLLNNPQFNTRYDIATNCPYGDGLHYDKDTDIKIYEIYKNFIF